MARLEEGFSISRGHRQGFYAHFAKAFGQETVAEGVEDSETLSMVRAFDVDYAQGFHVGEPTLVEGGQPAATA